MHPPLDSPRLSSITAPARLASIAVALQGAAVAGFASFQVSGAATWFRVAAAAHLAGAVVAGLAALPGALEWALTPPRLHRARTVGLVHGLVVLAALACSAANALATFPHRTEPPGDGLAVLLGCAAGWSLLVIGRWSGWTLASRHRVGLAVLVERAVRPRTAAASRRRR